MQCCFCTERTLCNPTYVTVCNTEPTSSSSYNSAQMDKHKVIYTIRLYYNLEEKERTKREVNLH